MLTMNLEYLKKTTAIILFGGFLMLAPLDLKAQNNLDEKPTDLIEDEKKKEKKTLKPCAQ